jgi:GMP synthase (glutamine-hydrolysing)
VIKLLDVKDFIDKSIAEIKSKTHGEKVVAACSGGVDSTTASYLAHKALGKNVLTVFIDDGLRREGEPEFTVNILKSLGMNYKYMDAKKEFFEVLKGKKDAEEKRKAFREKFYRKLGEIVKAEGAKFLVQGTIAPDIIETVGGIKTQHNVLEQIGIDPKTYGFEVLEPLKELYKPGVREVARALKLPKETSERMPFPGPALSIRCVGEVTTERIDVLRKATKIVEVETKDINAFQSFAVLLSDKATGMKDGKRVYGDIIVVRTISSKDAVKAKAIKLPYTLLNKISKRLTAELPSVVRCLYDVTDKPPATIEFE